MESSLPDETNEFLATFSAQRQRMLGYAARVLARPADSWADGREAGMVDESGPLPAILLASLEELKVAEEELHRQHETFESTRAVLADERDRFRMLFESAPAALMLTDTVGSIHEANRAAAQLLGREAYFLERKPMAALVATEERAEFRRALGRIALTGGTTDWRFSVLRPRDLPMLVHAAVSIVADSRFGSALYWHLEPVRPVAE